MKICYYGHLRFDILDWFHKRNYENLFLQTDPKSAKIHWWLDCLFALLGSACLKTACKMLLKLTLGLNFTNIYEQLLILKILKSQKDSEVVSLFFAILGSAHTKAAHKMLVKLTHDHGQMLKNIVLQPILKNHFLKASLSMNALLVNYFNFDYIRIVSPPARNLDLM